MQDSGIIKTIKNDHQSAISHFIFAQFVMGYPCASLHILLGQAILLMF